MFVSIFKVRKLTSRQQILVDIPGNHALENAFNLLGNQRNLEVVTRDKLLSETKCSAIIVAASADDPVALAKHLKKRGRYILIGGDHEVPNFTALKESLPNGITFASIDIIDLIQDGDADLRE